MDIKDGIKKVLEGKNLSAEEARIVMGEIMSGQASPEQIAAFLVGLRMKGETIAEITEFARVMRGKANQIKCRVPIVVDTCGTGGDGKHTFNISTVATFIVAGTGLVVAKHGNRSVSSRCGSADVLEFLGAKIDLPPKKVEKCLDEIGVGFLFAPVFHPAMKYATPVRRAIGVRTVFNILGPLTNPAGARRQLLGVFSRQWVHPLAQVLGNLGSEHVFVMHSEDGLDEVTTTGKTWISEWASGEVKDFFVEPEEFGMPKATLEELQGTDVEKNAQILLDILGGEKSPRRDIAVLNAAFAICAGKQTEAVAGQKGKIKEYILLAEQAIDSGKALKKLNQLKEYSNRK